MVSSAHIRAARGLLHWTIRDLAEKSGVHRNTITRMENDAEVHGPTMAAIVRAFEEAGVEFLNDGEPGVRLRNPT
jgi:transcriptional regulator with XRE-family HTH domain